MWSDLSLAVAVRVRKQLFDFWLRKCLWVEWRRRKRGEGVKWRWAVITTLSISEDWADWSEKSQVQLCIITPFSVFTFGWGGKDLGEGRKRKIIFGVIIRIICILYEEKRSRLFITKWDFPPCLLCLNVRICVWMWCEGRSEYPKKHPVLPVSLSLFLSKLLNRQLVLSQW